MLGDSGGDLGRGLSYSSDCQLFTSAPGRLGRTASRHEQEVYMSRKSMSLSVFRALHKGAAGGTAAAT